MKPDDMDAVLDALNATYAAMDRHGIDRSNLKGDSLIEHLNNIVEALRAKADSLTATDSQ